MADQPPPGGTTVAMPGAGQPPPGGAMMPPAAQRGGDQPPPGGSIVSMQQGPDDEDQPEPQVSSWQELKNEAGQFVRAADTSFDQVPDAAYQLLRTHLPHVADAIDKAGAVVNDALGKVGMHNYVPTSAQVHATATRPIEGVAGYTGAALETMAEWMVGEGEMKAMTQGERMTKIAQNVRLLEKTPKLAEAIASHPEVARVLGTGAKQATMGAAQSLAHGNTPSTALMTGAATGAGGMTLEGIMAGVGKLVKAIAPSSTEALGETLPVLASQKPGAAPIAEKVASIADEPQVAREIQQGAQRGIVNRAQQSAYNELEKLNQARQARWVAGQRDINLAPEEVAGSDRQLGTGQAQLPSDTTPQGTAPQLEAGTPPTGLARTNEVGPYEGDIPESQPTATAQQPPQPGPAAQPSKRVSYIEEQPPNFQPIDSTGQVQGIRTFKDAANKIREHAAPIFARFDSATGGEYTRLRDILNKAYDNQDYGTVHDAEDAIDSLFDQTQGKVDRLDFKAAKSAWRSSKILDAVHSAVSRSFNIADESLAADADSWRGINGGKLMNGINRLTERYGRAPIENIIGKDGLTGLTKIANLTQTPQRAAMYGQVVGDISNSIAGAATKRGIIGGTLDEARKLVLHSVATNPTVARYVEYAVKNRIAPKIFAPLIAATINQQTQNQEPDQTQEPQ